MKGSEAQRPMSGLNEFQLMVLVSYGTMMKLLPNWQEAGRLNIWLMLILPTDEGLPLDRYERIAWVFIAKVGNSQAASECPFISYSCEYGWLRIYSDTVLLEPVVADYRPVSPGVQSHTVLISNLANQVQPILRDDLGHNILQRPDQCLCGTPLQVIRVQGRAADMLTFPTDHGDHITIPPRWSGASICHIPGIEPFQVVQTTPANLRVRLRLAEGADPDRTWQADYAERMPPLAGHKLDYVTLERAGEPPEQSPGGKYREVIPLSIRG